MLAGLGAFAVAAGACRCGGDGPEEAPVAILPGQPVRPVIVRPVVVPARVEPAPVGRTVIRSAPLLPPIVRGPRQIDVYTQDEAIVDVLWVVDNSSSLNNERNRLAAQFDRFVSVLLAAQVDFHVGVISTDLSDPTRAGVLRGPVPWIDRATRNPRAVFADAVTFPNDETVVLEEGLEATEIALTPPVADGPNRGFIRAEAALAIIVVSDEDDGSLGPTAHFVRFLKSVKGPGRSVNVSLSAVVGPLPDGCYSPGEEHIFGAQAKEAERYIEVAEATGGLVESVCAADFAPFVETLATSLAGLRRFFPLSAPPEPDSIEVRVDGVPVARDDTNGWTWLEDERAVTFNGAGVPSPGAELQIAYDVSL